MRLVWSILTLLFLSVNVVASSTQEDMTFVWGYQFEEGYITTAPLIQDDIIYVRSSGYWTGEGRPELVALTMKGEVLWNFTHPTSTQHDMAPPVMAMAGEGSCGTWGDLVLVLWANGDLIAFDARSGQIEWSITTPLDGWGLTGTAILDDDRVLVPTRTGIAGVCLADGEVQFEVQLDHGWRNGPVVYQGMIWQGGESGLFTSVSKNGTVLSEHVLGGKIRHAPLVVAEGLLLHLQHESSSTIGVFNTENATFRTISTSGPSPAQPLQDDGIVMAADSTGVTILDCRDVCEVKAFIETTSNGELSLDPDGALWVPINEADKGWLIIDINTTSFQWTASEFVTPHDTYGTASAAFPMTANLEVLLANDAGLLMAYGTVSSNTITSGYDASLAMNACALFSLLALSGILMGLQSFHLSKVLFTACLLGSLVVLTPTLSQEWSQFIESESDEPLNNGWNESWPEAWRGTQILTIESKEGTQTFGGFVGYQTVLELTEAVALSEGITLETEATALGTYVISIGELGSNGWEYTVDGSRTYLAVDQQVISSTTIIVWTLNE